MFLVMRSTQQLSITLPIEMAEAVKAKVASGEYASESEVIRDGLRVLMARDRAVDHWLKTEVVESIKAVDEGRARTHTAQEVRSHLASLYEQDRARKKA